HGGSRRYAAPSNRSAPAGDGRSPFASCGPSRSRSGPRSLASGARTRWLEGTGLWLSKARSSIEAPFSSLRHPGWRGRLLSHGQGRQTLDGPRELARLALVLAKKSFDLWKHPNRLVDRPIRPGHVSAQTDQVLDLAVPGDVRAHFHGRGQVLRID